MLINCYYYAPHNHTMLTEHIVADLNKMVEIGTDVVSICIQESQIENWHWKHIDNFILLAHRAGLKVHAVPNRWAGLFAGWLDGFSSFSMENQHLLTEDVSGNPVIKGEMACCINKPEVREYIENNLQYMFAKFDFDGIIWDEPHATFCHCEHCKAKGIDSSTMADRAFCTYLDHISLIAKAQGRDIVTSVFTQPQNDSLLNALIETVNIDYIGSDGHLRSPGHQMHRMKGTIFEVYDKFAHKIKAAGKKTFFLLEGQRHRDEDLDNYINNVDDAFSMPMDHLMYYFSAHEMSPENETIFNRATWNAVKKLKAKPGLVTAGK